MDTVGAISKEDPVAPDAQAMVSALKLKDVILHAAEYTKHHIRVCGKIVMYADDIQRLDIADEGARLIIDYTSSQIDPTALEVGNIIAVDGKLTRVQRRLYLMAHNISKIDNH